jgi:hypothetical protein
MAKKKTLLSGNKAVFLVAGGGIIAVTVILLVGPLYVENFPIDVYGIGDQILVQFTNVFPPDELTVQEQQENAEINVMIEDVLNPNVGDCGFEPESEINGIPVISHDFSEPECDEQNQLNELEEMINEPDDPMPNMTSTDPPIEQLCDIEPTNPLCIPIPPPALLNLVTTVTKIDSQGNMTFVTGEVGFSQLAFFVEDTTNIDFQQGFLEIGLLLKGEALIDYNGLGTFDILIANQTIFASPIPLTVSGTSDTDGNLSVEFIGPTGTPSTVLNFAFEDHFDKFADEQLSDITMVVDIGVTSTPGGTGISCVGCPISGNGEVTIQTGPIDFSLIDQVVFTMGIARDDQQIIITDESGFLTRVYPTDSRILVSTTSHNARGQGCQIGQQQINGMTWCGMTTCTFYGTKTGTFPASCNQAFFSGPYSVSGPTYTAKPLNSFTLTDEQGVLLATGLGGSSGIVFDETLTRNENYTLDIGSPMITSELSFGKAQETQSYMCSPTSSTTHTVTQTRTCYVCGQGPSCSSPCYWLDKWFLNPVFREGALQCDLP